MHRGPQGQPQGHQGLGRPRQARRRASSRRTPARRARRAGTSSPPTATCSPTAAPRPTPQAYLTKFFEQRRRPARQRPRRHHRVHRRHRRRAALLRERGDPGPPERRGLRLRRPRRRRCSSRTRARSPSDADPTAKAFLDFLLSEEGQTDVTPSTASARWSTASTVEVEGANDPADPFPAPKTLLTIDEDFGGWAEANDEVLRRGRRHRHQDPGGDRQVVTLAAVTRRGPAGAHAPVGPAGRADAGLGLGLGVAMIWFSLLVLIPLAAVVVAGAERRLGGVLGHAHQPADRWPRSGSPSSRRCCVTRVNVVMGTLIAWVLVRDRFLGQAVARRPHRHPVRAADDRRRPGAARRSTARQSPLGVDVANTRSGGVPRAGRS